MNVLVWRFSHISNLLFPTKSCEHIFMKPRITGALWGLKFL